MFYFPVLYKGGVMFLKRSRNDFFKTWNIRFSVQYISLSCPNKHNGLATDVGHGNGRPNFVIDGVKLGQNDAVDSVRIVAGGMIGESCVELDKLINCFVAHKSLANKKNQIRSIY